MPEILHALISPMGCELLCLLNCISIAIALNPGPGFFAEREKKWGLGSRLAIPREFLHVFPEQYIIPCYGLFPWKIFVISTQTRQGGQSAIINSTSYS